jgi:hypothetical protein
MEDTKEEEKKENTGGTATFWNAPNTDNVPVDRTERK